MYIALSKFYPCHFTAGFLFPDPGIQPLQFPGHVTKVQQCFFVTCSSLPITDPIFREDTQGPLSTQNPQCQGSRCPKDALQGRFFWDWLHYSELTGS